MESEKVRNEFF